MKDFLVAGASSIFDTVGNASTLIGVVVGAVVATAGSFAASWYERQLFRREREKDAALVFAEILRSLALEVALVEGAHGRGDPFGPITIRMCRIVRREVDIYDRNRERLFVVRDANVRRETVSLIGRLTFAIDRVLDSTDALAARPDEAERAELLAGREQALEFLIECAEELPALSESFASLANARLPDYDLEAVGFGRPPRVGQG